MNNDQLQNEILLLGHHLEDLEGALTRNEPDVAKASLGDMKEGLKRLSGLLPQSARKEVQRLTPEAIAATIE